MSRVGVTGASGFIGGALLPALRAAGHQVVAFDNHSGPLWVERRDESVTQSDFRSEAALQALASCDVVLHLAAVSGVMACAQDPVGSARVNLEGTRALVAACRARKVPLAFASSFAVVGRPERLPVTERTPARPTHEYARQKAEGETIVRALSGPDGVASAVLRMSNVYGSYVADGRVVAKGNVIAKFVEQAPSGHLSVNAPGTQRRDFIHIADVLRHWVAIVPYLQSSPPEPATFSVASGESHSVLEVADLTQAAWAVAHPDRSPLAIDVVENPRKGIELVDPEFSVDRTETEQRLGVRCERTVEATLTELIPREPAGFRARGRG